MWAFSNDLVSKPLTKVINKRMCMRYKQVMERLLWIVEAKRVDLNNEVSIEQTTDKRFEILVLWEDGNTEQISLKDMNLSLIHI